MVWWNRFLELFKKKSEVDTMKYLVVGLGNMHPDYDNTRHNVGFDIVDTLANENNLKFENDRLGDLALFKFKGRQIYLLKPSTYMNLSGKSVLHWLLKKKIPVKHLLVIVDDKNLDLGKIRIRGKGSDGGHNGLKDIQNHLGGNQYARLRIGIGNDFQKGRQVDFVLGKWSDLEREKLQPVIENSINAVKDFVFRGLQQTMNTHNN
jgi:PTH1 family peptidyl-tRNA hydrolase